MKVYQQWKQHGKFSQLAIYLINLFPSINGKLKYHFFHYFIYIYLLLAQTFLLHPKFIQNTIKVVQFLIKLTSIKVHISCIHQTFLINLNHWIIIKIFLLFLFQIKLYINCIRACTCVAHLSSSSWPSLWQTALERLPCSKSSASPYLLPQARGFSSKICSASASELQPHLVLAISSVIYRFMLYMYMYMNQWLQQLEMDYSIFKWTPKLIRTHLSNGQLLQSIEAHNNSIVFFCLFVKFNYEIVYMNSWVFYYYSIFIK